ncbi:MAG: hypothetical protein AAGI15_08355 [Pseudomonadota bacterium]
MIDCLCLVQEGQGPDRQRTALAGALDAFAREQFGVGLQARWVPVAPGYGFTAGAPSSSSVVSLAAPEPLTQDRREAALRALVALWTEHTGCSVDEIVAVVADPVTH